VNYQDMGSTTSGVYAVDGSGKFYSVNVATGNASVIGSTGLTLSAPALIGLSTGSTTLYLTVTPTPSSLASLYSLNTVTGTATLIGNTGVADLGAMVFENGALYAGSGSTGGPWSIYTLNTSTGAATLVTTTSSTSSDFWGLAPLGLSIQTLGTGGGTVTDNQSYIDCAQAAGGAESGTCFSDTSAGSMVTLTATPATTTPPTTFGGWGGACAGAGTSATCYVTVGSSPVTADFVAPPQSQTLTFQAGPNPPPVEAIFDCPDGGNPCVDQNAHALQLSITNGGAAGLTVRVTAT